MKSVEWKCTVFFDQMDVLLLEIEDGQPEGFDGMLRERFYQAAAAKLPAAMSIEPGDIALNRENQTLEGLKALAKSRLKFVKSSRGRRMNQVGRYDTPFDIDQATAYSYPGMLTDPIQGSEFDETLWVNKVQQQL